LTELSLARLALHSVAAPAEALIDVAEAVREITRQLAA
jgi:hypothetical protein